MREALPRRCLGQKDSIVSYHLVHVLRKCLGGGPNKPNPEISLCLLSAVAANTTTRVDLPRYLRSNKYFHAINAEIWPS
jgi:hypothetical protein